MRLSDKRRAFLRRVETTSMRIRKALVLVATTFVLAAATSADAQGTAPIDISAGYQFTRFNGSGETDGTSVPQGWTASVTGHFSPALNLVGEVNGAYKDDRKRHSFLGGLRVGGGRSPATNEAVVFGQFLIGASRFAGSNAFVMQPGAGLDIRGTGRVE